LHGINILLSRTEGPVNLGMTARAMANTGFTSLSFTGELQRDDEEALKYAVHADGILKNAFKAADFEQLISTSDRVIGFSPRSPYGGEKNIDITYLKEYTQKCLSEGLSVGLLFGNEASGLDNAELASCAKTVALPTHSSYPSMNLAQAVLVSLWEIKDIQSIKPESTDYAQRETINTLLSRLKEQLELIDFFNEQNPDSIWQEITQMIESKNLTKREAELMLAVTGKTIIRYSHLLRR